MDREDVVYRYPTEYNSAIKNKKIMPLTATWMDLEITMLSEVNQTKKDKSHYSITYRQNQKYDTDEPIYKTDSQT